MKKNSILKRIILISFIVFILMNIIAFFHAYKFTHFSTKGINKTATPEKLTLVNKAKTLFFGVNNPKPINYTFPTRKFETVLLKNDKTIEGWYIKTEKPRGTIILFHGYSGKKSAMLDKAEEFLKLEFNTFLIDFRGSGNSEGTQTTIGFYEADDVKCAYEYILSEGEENIYLMGTSMGAVAILKSIADYKLPLSGIIIECPFGSMYQTVCARFDRMNVPAFPMASLLVFWGGIQNNFWAFGHNPSEYSKSVGCPVLLLYGAKDKSVSRTEIDEIFKNLNGRKELKIYESAGHDNYLIKYREEWITDVKEFLEANKKTNS